jgi:two-component system phosphate regulon sensor histidine kinase PhoR
MFVETLQLGRLPEPERQREALSIIASETERLSALINRLLDWARMESGKRSYEADVVPVDVVVDAALRAVEPLRVQSRAQLLREVVPGLPPLRGDRDAVVDALVDLLQNAFKYTGPDKRIVVAADTTGNAIRLRVSDNGPGIPGAEQVRIFDKFYRGKDPLQRTIEGSGLGLSMVKHIVEAHKGTVSVASEVGKGATFTILLPQAEAK